MFNYEILVLCQFEIINNRLKILFNEKFNIINYTSYADTLIPILNPERKYDLIFLDADNTKDEGFEILKKLKECFKENPVIFISSSYTTELLDKIKKFQDCSCIIKPFNNKTVIDKIISLLSIDAVKTGNNKINKIEINVNKNKGSVNEEIEMKVKITGKKGMALNNETIAVEIFNNPGIEMKTLTTDHSGEASLGIELVRSGKINILSYLESNPSLEDSKTVTVSENTDDKFPKVIKSDNVKKDISFKKVFIILFTKENGKYQKILKNINYHTNKGIKSLEKVAEILAINDKNELKFTLKNYNPKKCLLITDSFENLEINEIEIIEIKGHEKIDFYEKGILIKLKKMQVL